MPKHDPLPRRKPKLSPMARLTKYLWLRTSAPKRPQKPPEAGIAIPAVPPSGPLPKQGGAEAPLEFE